MNSTLAAVPANYITRTRDELLNSLNSFWRAVYGDREFIHSLGDAYSSMAAQVYLDFVETAGKLGVLSTSDFRRRMLVPLVLRKSQRNTGPTMHLGMEGLVLGPSDGSVYPADTVHTLGGAAVKADTVVYRLPAPVSDIAGYASSLPFGNGTTLLRNTDFTTDGNIITFQAAKDPFSNLDNYLVQKIRLDDGSEDLETVLWLTDVLVDFEDTQSVFGYIAGLTGTSGAAYHRALNALWDVRVAGNAEGFTRPAIAALFGVPCTGNAVETVVEVITDEPSGIQVITDREVYRLGPAESPAADVYAGAVLPPGTWLSASLRIYRSLRTGNFYSMNNKTLSQFIIDVPRLYIRSDSVGVAGVDQGLSLHWEEVDVTYHGRTPGGYPKLKFDVGMDSANDLRYWNAVWDRSDRTAVPLDTIFGVTDPGDGAAAGTVVGTVNPMKHWMDNVVGSNMSVLVVDAGALPSYSTATERLRTLADMLPAEMMLMTVINFDVGDDDISLGQSSDSTEYMLGTRVSDDGDLVIKDNNIRIRWVRKCS